jgi:hypothetical protein
MSVVYVHRLPDMNETAFEIYAEWHYKGPMVFDDKDIFDGEESDELDNLPLIHSYLLATRLADSKFRRAILEMLVVVCVDTEITPGPEPITLVYHETPGPCALRRLLVALYEKKAYPFWLDNEYDLQYPIAFMNDPMNAISKHRTVKEETTAEVKGILEAGDLEEYTDEIAVEEVEE